MYYFLAALSGFLISIMIVFNGQLTDYYGLYSGTLLIHIIGLLFITIIMLFKREKFKITNKIPLYTYLCGAVSFSSVIFNSFCFGKLDVTAIIAIGLLGQICVSLTIDHFGLFGMDKKKFDMGKLIGLSIMMLGIIIMVGKVSPSKIAPILCAFLVGVPVVLSRTLTGEFSKYATQLQATFYNYVGAVITSIIFALFLSHSEPIFTSGLKINANPFIYLGGLLGVGVVFLCSVAVVKISSFDLTIIQFIGQSFTGIILDIMLSGHTSSVNLIGSLLVTIGLIVNVTIDKKKSSALNNINK